MSISSISPSSVAAGGQDITLIVTGSNLDLVHPGAHITNTTAVWSANRSQTDLTTNVLSGTQLTAVVPAALLTTPVTAQVFIQKWYFADDGPFLTSNYLTFTVTIAGSASTATGSMAVARAGHSATLLPNGIVLVAGGANSSGTLRSAELYDPAKGTFTQTGDLAFPRQGHSATLLPNGRVLIAGGEDDVGPIATAELYDSVSGTFTSVGSMTSVRWSHTATLLANGKVLLAGGADNSNAQDSAEVFDSVSNTFAPVSNMTTPRIHHTGTLLANGKVLLAGGWSGFGSSTALNSAELFDPATNSFASVGNMSVAHWFHGSVLLPDGRVLVVSGNKGMFSTAVMEAFDPVSESFAIVGNLTQARHSHTVTLLPKGGVLVTGGIYKFSGPDAPESTVLASSELYSPGSSSTEAAATLTRPRAGHTATLLNDGRVLVVGGSDSDSAEILKIN
jgi:Galactose oxidase, central domain/Kelch motif